MQLINWVLVINFFLITNQIWNDFKDLNDKLLGNNENWEERNSNSNKTWIGKLR
jgi:hypothetical protein